MPRQKILPRAQLVLTPARLGLVVSILLCFGLASGPLQGQTANDSDDEPATFLDSIKRGTVSLALRLRGEHVEQDSFDDDADISGESTRKTTSTIRFAATYPDHPKAAAVFPSVMIKPSVLFIFSTRYLF